jgi:hypothetical protein
VKPKSWTIHLQDLPHLEQQIDWTNDPTIIHVPLLVNGAKIRNPIDKRLETTAEIQRTERITLLNTTSRQERT